MPTEHQKYVDEQYEKFMAERRKKQQDEIRKKEEEIKRNAPPKPTPGISPMKLGISRDPAVNRIPLTRQVLQYDNNDIQLIHSFICLASKHYLYES